MKLYQLEHIVHRYNGSPVLTIDDWSLAADAIVGIRGPNGSGKSTLLELLGFVQHPCQGSIRFNGQPTTPFAPHIRGQVALLPQTPYLLKRSVYANIAYGMQLRKERIDLDQRVEEALNLVGLTPEVFAQRPWFALSGGEARRVALAARLALRPSVLLLDEPTASVDAASAIQMRSAALQARQQWRATVIITSHDDQWLQDISDQIFYLFRGHILGQGKKNLFFGPWHDLHNGGVFKSLPNGQRFEVAYAPADLQSAVALINPDQIRLFIELCEIPPHFHYFQSQIQSLSLDRSSGQIEASLLVGAIPLSARLLDPASNFTPGQKVWVAYDPRQVQWC